MPISRTKKEEMVRSIKARIAKAKSISIVGFHGLSVAKTQDLRRKFRAEGTEYSVIKKTLLMLALKDSGKEVPENLEGEVAIATSETDELTPFKVAQEFSKKEKGALKLLAGYFEDNLVDADKSKQLGLIPGRDALIAQLMSVIQGNTKKFVNILDQLSKVKN